MMCWMLWKVLKVVDAFMLFRGFVTDGRLVVVESLSRLKIIVIIPFCVVIDFLDQTGVCHQDVKDLAGSSNNWRRK